MAELNLERVTLDAQGIQEAIGRLAREILAANGEPSELAIVGIHTGGVHLARRLGDAICEIAGSRASEGSIDITLYRDDVFIGLPQPIVGRTEMPFDMTGIKLVLVDDVLFTGRTVRSALDAVIDYGRPAAIRLCVLVDRGHREFPIQADYVGSTVETGAHHAVKVELTEEGAPLDRIALYTKGDP